MEGRTAMETLTASSFVGVSATEKRTEASCSPTSRSEASAAISQMRRPPAGMVTMLGRERETHPVGSPTPYVVVMETMYEFVSSKFERETESVWGEVTEVPSIEEDILEIVTEAASQVSGDGKQPNITSSMLKQRAPGEDRPFIILFRK